MSGTAIPGKAMPGKAMQIDVADLRLFVAVTDAGSMTAAAQRVHRALASVSERLRDLELAVGVTLLERTRRGVRPTAAGQALLHHARLVLAQLDRLGADIAEHAAGLRGRIRLICNTAALSDDLPDVLGAYLAEHPNIDIDLEELPSVRIVAAVAQGFADLGIVADSADATGLECVELRPDPLVAVCAADHPFRAHEQIAFARLLDEPFVALSEGSALHEHLAARAAALQRVPVVRLRMRDFESVLKMVAAGVGVSVVPDCVATRWARSYPVHRIALADPWAARRLMLCMRRRDALPAHVAQLVDRLLAGSGRDPRSGPQEAGQGVGTGRGRAGSAPTAS